MLYNANELKYQLVTINEVRGLFVDERILPESIPEWLNKYEIRSDDDGKGDPVTLEHNVFVNFYGSFLTRDTLDINEDRNTNYLSIEQFKYSGPTISVLSDDYF